jgi:hypothetical protein
MVKRIDYLLNGDEDEDTFLALWEERFGVAEEGEEAEEDAEDEEDGEEEGEEEGEGETDEQTDA